MLLWCSARWTERVPEHRAIAGERISLMLHIEQVCSSFRASRNACISWARVRLQPCHRYVPARANHGNDTSGTLEQNLHRIHGIFHFHNVWDAMDGVNFSRRSSATFSRASSERTYKMLIFVKRRYSGGPGKKERGEHVFSNSVTRASKHGPQRVRCSLPGQILF